PTTRAARPPGPDFRDSFFAASLSSLRALSSFLILFLKCSALLLGLLISPVGGRRHVLFSNDFDFAAVELVWAARFRSPDRHCRGGVGAGSPAKRPRRVRFLRAVAVVVALLLRAGVGARRRPLPDAVRGTAVFLRGARPVAAI